MSIGPSVFPWRPSRASGYNVLPLPPCHNKVPRRNPCQHHVCNAQQDVWTGPNRLCHHATWQERGAPTRIKALSMLLLLTRAMTYYHG